jgi:hypothetical protein
MLCGFRAARSAECSAAGKPGAASARRRGAASPAFSAPGFRAGFERLLSYDYSGIWAPLPGPQALLRQIASLSRTPRDARVSQRHRLRQIGAHLARSPRKSNSAAAARASEVNVRTTPFTCGCQRVCCNQYPHVGNLRACDSLFPTFGQGYFKRVTQLMPG